MKIFLLIFLILFSNDIRASISKEDIEYLPELRSAAWSPDLTKEDIYKTRLAIYGMSKGNATDARSYLAPYIHDKRNVEARYIYALTLARTNIDQSLEMLKELSIEGYPFALETYRAERVCDLKQYKDICTKHGIKEVMHRAYLNWARKDPLIPDMYFIAVTYLPNYGSIPGEQWMYTSEATAILKEGIDAKCFRCAQSLYSSYLIQVKDGDNSKRKLRDKYRAIKKQLLFSGITWKHTAIPGRNCYKNKEYAINYGRVCLTKEENQQLLRTLAIRGNVRAFVDLTILLELDKGSDISFYDYIRFGDDGSLPKVTKALYDEAIKLNNDRGWGYHGYLESIEPWEKLYKNKKTKSFFEKVGNLLNK